METDPGTLVRCIVLYEKFLEVSNTSLSAFMT
jgi:hypothetical protein